MTIGLLGFSALLLLILLQIPIGIAMVVVGVLGFYFLTGDIFASLSIVGTESAAAISNTDLAIIPLFILMGHFAHIGGLSAELYRLAQAFCGHIPGGLAMATVAGSAGFGAASGSSIATTTLMTKIALPEMEKKRYGRELSVGVIAAGGTLGSLIPPSIVMVIYAFLSEQFIIELFIGALLPALITLLLYFCTIFLWAKIRSKDAPQGAQCSWRYRMQCLLESWRSLLLIATMTGGIYGGVFTVTESASAGCILALTLAAFRKKLNKDTIGTAISETAGVAGLLYTILIGAKVFGNFLTLSHLPAFSVAWIKGLALSPILTIVFIAILYLLLGAVFDSVAAMVLTLPFVLPVVTELGYHPIWWGIVMVVLIEVGMISPPIGLNVFVLHDAKPDIPLRDIYRGVIPFLLADFLRLLILILLPSLALWHLG